MDKLELFRKDSYDFIDSHRYAVACGITAMVGALMLRRWVQGGVCRSKVQLNGKTVLITGANTGIGKETARDIAGRGARVILACRDLTRGETAATEIRKSTGNGNVVVYKLDLASLKSVRSCAEEVKAKEQRLDILINNAGVMWTPRWKTEDGFEMQFGTNHLGHFLFTNLLLDLLKASAPSRIVNVSSKAHERGTMNFDDINSEKSFSPLRAYSQSKLANVLFTRELAKRLKGTQVTTYALHPGVIKTELGRHLGMLDDLDVPFVFKNPYNRIFPIVLPLLKTPKAGAQTTIHCAVSEELEGVSGKYYSDCAEKEPIPEALKDDIAARLWKLSEEMVGWKPADK